MAKGKYTQREDEFIVSYFDAIGPYIGPHDLGRSEASVKRRAKHLKNSGAWRLMEIKNAIHTQIEVRCGRLPDDCIAALKTHVYLSEINLSWMKREFS